jgi:hypothetical protein
VAGDPKFHAPDPAGRGSRRPHEPGATPGAQYNSDDHALRSSGAGAQSGGGGATGQFSRTGDQIGESSNSRKELDDVDAVKQCARVAELADAPDLGSGGATRGGSSPPFRTISFQEISFRRVLRLAALPQDFGCGLRRPHGASSSSPPFRTISVFTPARPQLATNSPCRISPGVRSST